MCIAALKQWSSNLEFTNSSYLGHQCPLQCNYVVHIKFDIYVFIFNTDIVIECLVYFEHGFAENLYARSTEHFLIISCLENYIHDIICILCSSSAKSNIFLGKSQYFESQTNPST
jgi:hypothetical protein